MRRGRQGASRATGKATSAPGWRCAPFVSRGRPFACIVGAAAWLRPILIGSPTIRKEYRLTSTSHVDRAWVFREQPFDRVQPCDGEVGVKCMLNGASLASRSCTAGCGKPDVSNFSLLAHPQHLAFRNRLRPVRRNPDSHAESCGSFFSLSAHCFIDVTK